MIRYGTAASPLLDDSDLGLFYLMNQWPWPYSCFSILLQVDWGKLSFPFVQHWWGYTWSTVSSSGLHSSRETQTYWNKPSKGPWRQLGYWSISAIRKGWESWDCSVWRRIRRSLPTYTNTWTEDIKKSEAGSFQWCPVTGQEAVDTNCNMTECKEMLFHCEGDQGLEWVARGVCGISCLGDTRKLSGRDPVQAVWSDRAWAGGLDQMVSRGPSRLQPFRDALHALPHRY